MNTKRDLTKAHDTRMGLFRVIRWAATQSDSYTADHPTVRMLVELCKQKPERVLRLIKRARKGW